MFISSELSAAVGYATDHVKSVMNMQVFVTPELPGVDQVSRVLSQTC